MTNATLAAILQYSTPTQSQQASTPSQKETRQDTPAQKRKRGDKSSESDQAPPQQTTETGVNTHIDQVGIPMAMAHQVTPTPQHQGPPLVDKVPSYNVPQFNRERSTSPLPSPTSEAVKRRKLLTQAQDNSTTQNGTRREQEMLVDDESCQPGVQNNTPTPKEGGDKVRPPNRAPHVQNNIRNPRITTDQIQLLNWTKKKTRGPWHS